MNPRMSSIVCARSPVAIGSRVAERTARYATGFSGGVGSSIHSGANGSSSVATAAAVDDVKRPCISIMMPTSGPTASRTAATIATARRRSAAASSALAWPNGSSFSARYPCATTLFGEGRDLRGLALGLIPAVGVRRHACVELAARAASTPARRATARSGPSTRRRSTRAPTARLSPGRSYSARWMFHARRSTSNGSLPMTCRGASSSRHATSVSVRLTMRTSLTPTRPVSVSSSRNTSSRHGVPTTVGRAAVIFTPSLRSATPWRQETGARGWRG